MKSLWDKLGETLYARGRLEACLQGLTQAVRCDEEQDEGWQMGLDDLFPRA